MGLGPVTHEPTGANYINVASGPNHALADFATSENAAMRLAVTCGKPALGQLRSVPSPAGDIGATLEQAGRQADGDERKL
jgi:hypothetical protein